MIIELKKMIILLEQKNIYLKNYYNSNISICDDFIPLPLLKSCKLLNIVNKN
jgi:hypothetical protein